MNFKIEENELFCLWNTEPILISETPKSYRINKRFLKIGDLENKRCWHGIQKVKLIKNKPPKFLLLYVITNKKTVKLTQIDRFAIRLQDFSRGNTLQ